MTTLPTDLIIRKDGDSWMLCRGDFVNLAESKVWWGDTIEEALEAWRQAEYYALDGDYLPDGKG